jgi:hypothetical protein
MRDDNRIFKIITVVLLLVIISLLYLILLELRAHQQPISVPLKSASIDASNTVFTM